jgi:hypothetical protein
MSFSAVNLDEVITQEILDEILDQIVPTVAIYNAIITPNDLGAGSVPPNRTCAVNLLRSFNSNVVTVTFEGWQFILGGVSPANDVESFDTDASMPGAFHPTSTQLCGCFLFDDSGVNSSVSVSVLTNGIITFEVIGAKVQALHNCGLLDKITFVYLLGV